MRKFKTVIICILVCAIILGGGSALALAAGAFPSETDPFGKNFFIGQTDQDEPFFEVTLPKIAASIKENNKNSISPYFDKLPVANNPENFQGLGSTTYANINGKTVTAEAFYRLNTDSLCDPNAGMGLMIYQCIQYKLAHPDEEVSITFSTYRTSATASVCVLPESKYYGYMRSLYTTNYDEHGFVRISYMLTEAARMGIEVLMLNQLPTYSVKQYNPKKEKLQSRKQIDYAEYFEKAAQTDCYDKYAKGKKVSDFLDCTTVGWTVGDQSGNMQHVKSCTVSHYLATDGTEHQNAVFFTTSNLDENDYLGGNGNGWSQTGVILSDHDDIFRVTRNYTYLMHKYSFKEGLQEFRKLIMDMNEEQMTLIREGKGDQIPADEQIVYLGTENDPVFELYYTPLATGVDAWDVENNPICKHVDKLTQSENYVELAWNEFGFENNYLGVTIGKLLEDYYCSHPDPNNKIAVRVTDLKIDKIKNLEVGTEIGARSIKNGKTMHAKDFLMSYEEYGVRHNVSIMTSCNYVMIGFHYRTNSFLVINETEETGGNFYEILVPKYSSGIIKAE